MLYISLNSGQPERRLDSMKTLSLSEAKMKLSSLVDSVYRTDKAASQAILNDPQTGKGLRDELEGLQSFKAGKFRVIYKTATDKGIIEIVAIGPRKTIYEETLRLLKREKMI